MGISSLAGSLLCIKLNQDSPQLEKLTSKMEAAFPAPIPAALPSLTTREAITDTLQRIVLAFDTNDKTLFESSFVTDAVFDLDGHVLNGLDEICNQSFDIVSKLDTTHFISSLRLNYVEGASTASMTASALSQHYRQNTGKIPGATNFTCGSLYHLDVVRGFKVSKLQFNVVEFALTRRNRKRIKRAGFLAQKYQGFGPHTLMHHSVPLLPAALRASVATAIAATSPAMPRRIGLRQQDYLAG
ncbi:hypothetical protein PENANT_c068G08895 [Penicillium antarcticum]|uniref:SnoaL-like domain-containing protein n=1 Tax=Penicillium antarcticum TaxID=416450 RepID=A0A1V6PPS1_9EURO|nr:hypothetical protein PENANT_c068G08895 [Penicillium antarcticum]